MEHNKSVLEWAAMAEDGWCSSAGHGSVHIWYTYSNYGRCLFYGLLFTMVARQCYIN